MFPIASGHKVYLFSLAGSQVPNSAVVVYMLIQYQSQNAGLVIVRTEMLIMQHWDHFLRIREKEIASWVTKSTLLVSPNDWLVSLVEIAILLSLFVS